VNRPTELACGSKVLDRPLSRFPLRGQAGCTAASAALRLGQSAGPKQNANQRSGPVTKKAPYLGAGAPSPLPGAAPGANRLYAVNRTDRVLIKPDILTC
jgi:hypothetical protein